MPPFPRSKKTLEGLKPGSPACPVKTNGFYMTGETARVRELCQAGAWSEALKTMQDNLQNERWKASPAYAAWWAKATVDRYRADGVPPVMKRGVAGDGDDKAASADTPPLTKAIKRTADGKAKTPVSAVVKPVTLLDVLALVMASNGEFSNFDGETVIKFNGAVVYTGSPDTPEALKALHSDIKALVNLKPRVESLQRDLAAASAAMASFLEANEARMEQMGLPKASFLNDATAARAEAQLSKQRVAVLEATADDMRAEAARMRKALSDARAELEELKARAEEDDDEAASDEEDGEEDEEAASDEEDDEAASGDEEDDEAKAEEKAKAEAPAASAEEAAEEAPEEEAPEEAPEEDDEEAPVAKRAKATADFEVSEDEA